MAKTSKAVAKEKKVVTRGAAERVEKTLVFTKGVGHNKVATATLLNPNYEPARTGESRADRDALQAYRTQVRKDMAAVNKANSKRHTIFDAIVAKGDWGFKHPHQAATKVMAALRSLKASKMTLKLL